MTTLNKETIAALDIDSILDLTVEQLAEVTAFVPKPTGMYRFDIKGCSLEEYSGSHAIQVVYNITECVELENPENEESIGELPFEYKENYFIAGDSDFGVRAFRTILATAIEEGTTPSVRELMEMCVGLSGEGLLKFTKRKNKDTGEIREGNQWEVTGVAFS